MDDALKRIYAACDPDKPATPEFYVDCSEARGEKALAKRFIKHLERESEPEPGSEKGFKRFLFSGHVGCGKSSELAHLCYLLKQPGNYQRRYFPFLLNVSDYLDDFDVTLTDLLLAVVTEIAATLREDFGYELKDSYFKSRFNEIKGFFLSDIEINKGEIELPGAKLEVQKLKSSPEARRQVREALKEKEPQMLDEINRVFEEARIAVSLGSDSVSAKTYEDVVLIFDNLEKIQRFENHPEGLPSHRELFIERYAQLTRLEIHTIYTIPLRLARSVDSPLLTQRYCCDPFVLPMIKVFERGTRNPYTTGIEMVKKLLQKRLGSIGLADAFTPEALDFLMTYSGGHMRDLIRFVREATTNTDSLPISLKAVHQAIKPTVTTYSTSIPENHWEKLARLEMSEDQAIINDDPDYLKMLENLSVMEYINGGDDDIFAEAEPWYAVNPVVRELRKFKSAVNELQDNPRQ